MWPARDGRGLNVHARYTKGFTDILENNPGDAVTNSVFQFFVSFPFIATPEASGMNSLETLTAFFGWCTAINIGLLMVATLVLGIIRGSISQIHAKLFNLNEVDLSRAYFQYLAQYKIAILVLNLVPYIALKIVA